MRSAVLRLYHWSIEVEVKPGFSTGPRVGVVRLVLKRAAEGAWDGDPDRDVRLPSHLPSEDLRQNSRFQFLVSLLPRTPHNLRGFCYSALVISRYW